MRDAFALASGLVFGLGLIAGGMTLPSKVKGFLDVAGAWDPSLALVMGGAIAVGVFAFAAVRNSDRGWRGVPIERPEAQGIDARLVVGGLVFGVGWGLGGFCPGPALVALAAGYGDGFIVVAAMLVGMAAHDLISPSPLGEGRGGGRL